jgi:biotin carboxyl carrier protein
MESAMEECLDQDCEILYPPSQTANYISRATGELSLRHGPVSILSLPLRLNGQVLAVLTLERPTDKPFSLEEVEAIRLTSDLSTHRLLNLYEQERLVGARAIAKAHKGLSVLVGAEHTWAKVITILLCGVVLFLVFAKGQFRAESPFVIEPMYQQTICAPFDGYIKNVNVEVGDSVTAGDTPLAELDTAELRLRLAAAKAEKAGYLKQVAAAMRDNETAQAQIAQANADKVEAQIELLNYMIDQGRIVSPTAGTVVKGDLKRQTGAPDLLSVCPLICDILEISQSAFI